jgi:small subunit ribosomal protein S16
MLAIRMQRTGRKGHAMFRVVVQDSRLTPTSGKVVALLGSYDPHAKVATLDKEKAATYLHNGAQPSDRVVRLLQAEGVTLPEWVKVSEGKKGSLRNPEKLRKNQPKEEKPAAEEPAEAAATESEDASEEA